MIRRPLAIAVPGDITTLTGGYIYDRRLLEGLRDLGHKVQHIALPASFPDPSPEDQAKARALLCALPADQPVILDGLAFGALATETVAQVRAPIIALIHHPLAKESGLTPARRDHLFRTERDNLALARHVLVPSPHTAAILTAEYGVSPETLTTLRPGTDQPADTQAKIAPPLILSVGIQAPRKGHDVLLKALALLTEIPWQAAIVGGPHDRVHAASLVALQHTLGLTDRVRLAGQVSAGALAELYAQATVFALATRYEGYGIVFDEALSHGLPIVSCATGAVPDTVPEGVGLLVEPDDPERFAEGLARVLADAALRDAMATAARLAGARLPRWSDTAQLASRVVQAVT